MRKCLICKSEKKLSEFNKKSNRKDGLQTHCRECNRKISRKYYHDNREKHLKEVAIRKRKVIKNNQLKLLEILKNNSCFICGFDNHLALEFDHIKGNKFKEIGRIKEYSWKTIQKELDKCQILCANCHRIKTHKEQNTYRVHLLES